MAVKMRLRREGKKKQPHYRIVVADGRSPRDGRFLEDLGYYQPLAEPSAIKLDHDRALTWLRHGAQPSQSVVNLLRIEGVWEAFRPGDADAQAQRRERRARRRAERAAHKQPASQPAPAGAGDSGAASEAASGDADGPQGDASADRASADQAKADQAGQGDADQAEADQAEAAAREAQGASDAGDAREPDA